MWAKAVKLRVYGLHLMSNLLQSFVRYRLCRRSINIVRSQGVNSISGHTWFSILMVVTTEELGGGYKITVQERFKVSCPEDTNNHTSMIRTCCGTDHQEEKSWMWMWIFTTWILVPLRGPLQISRMSKWSTNQKGQFDPCGGGLMVGKVQ